MMLLRAVRTARQCVLSRGAGQRLFSSTSPLNGIEEFFAPVPKEGELPRKAGRAWEASELRLKSFDDLHALWFVCLKERNMLLSERLYYRQVGQAAPDGLRMGKVRTTMRLIKTVLGERARAMEAQKLDAERAERIAAVLAGTDRAAAASRISNRLSTVTVSFKRFGHKYTLPEDQLPEHPTRQQKRVAFKQKRHWDTVHSRRLALEAVEVAVGHRAPPRTPVASAAASST